jgi:predicted ATPase
VELVGKICGIKPFLLDESRMNVDFDVRTVTRLFHETLAKVIFKKGLFVEEVGEGEHKQDITIRGRFVQIDKGNRFLRYFLNALSLLKGKAVLEVSAEVLVGDRRVACLQTKSTGWNGFIGGGARGLLKYCAKTAAKKTGKQIIRALKKE